MSLIPPEYPISDSQHHVKKCGSYKLLLLIPVLCAVFYMSFVYYHDRGEYNDESVFSHRAMKLTQLNINIMNVYHRNMEYARILSEVSQMTDADYHNYHDRLHRVYNYMDQNPGVTVIDHEIDGSATLNSRDEL